MTLRTKTLSAVSALMIGGTGVAFAQEAATSQPIDQQVLTPPAEVQVQDAPAPAAPAPAAQPATDPAAGEAGAATSSQTAGQRVLTPPAEVQPQAVPTVDVPAAGPAEAPAPAAEAQPATEPAAEAPAADAGAAQTPAADAAGETGAATSSQTTGQRVLTPPAEVQVQAAPAAAAPAAQAPAAAAQPSAEPAAGAPAADAGAADAPAADAAGQTGGATASQTTGQRVLTPPAEVQPQAVPTVDVPAAGPAEAPTAQSQPAAEPAAEAPAPEAGAAQTPDAAAGTAGSPAAPVGNASPDATAGAEGPAAAPDAAAQPPADTAAEAPAEAPAAAPAAETPAGEPAAQQPAADTAQAAGAHAAAEPAAVAEPGGGHIEDITFSFEGPLGKFDQFQLQRGLQVYTEVCAACHGLRYVPLRTLHDEGGPGLPEDQTRAYAAAMTILDPETGEERPREPTDHFPTVTGDGMGPDLSMMAKARAGFHGPYGTGIAQFLQGTGGPEYIHALLTGYTGEEQEQAGTVLYQNTAFPSGYISMPAPLSEDLVTYEDGTPATVDQMARDVSAFLMWTAEPKMMARKQVGLVSVLFLIVLAGLLYYTNKRIWAPHKGRH